MSKMSKWIFTAPKSGVYCFENGRIYLEANDIVNIDEIDLKEDKIMALETLKGIKKIGEFNVINMDDLKVEKPELFNEGGQMDYKIFERDIRPHNFIYVRNDVNSLSFTLQNGPVKEYGVNGCQVDTVIEAAKLIIEGLNKNFPCRENSMVITKLDEALMWSKKRKDDREKRGVEGFNKA